MVINHLLNGMILQVRVPFHSIYNVAHGAHRIMTSSTLSGWVHFLMGLLVVEPIISYKNTYIIYRSYPQDPWDWYIYGQDFMFARLCNATSFGMVQMYCK